MIDFVSQTVDGLDALKKVRRKNRPDAQTPPPDRLPPNDYAAEAAAVGCVLLSPGECLDQLDELGMVPEWFYDLRLRKIFETIRALHFRQPRVAVDVITLQSELRQMGQLEEIGGLPYLGQLQDGVPSALNLPAYAETVKALWQFRQLVAIGTNLAAQPYEAGANALEIVEEAITAVNRLSELHTRRSERQAKVILREDVIPAMERHYSRGRAQITGLVTTGLEYLDKIFCGWGGMENGNFHVGAARPNIGKTSLSTGILLHAALDFVWNEEVTEAAARVAEAAGKTVFHTDDGRWLVQRKGIPCGYSSLESTGAAIVKKMLFQRSRADLQLWRTGYATKEDFPPLVKAAAEISGPENILIDDTPRETMSSIKAKWRRWHRQYGVRFFMLDYIQLIKSPRGRFRPDRVQEMEDICAELQALGKELNCPMFVLCQLNRDYEKEPNRLPRLSDLKNCGAIEQDADSVTLLYKPSPYKPFSKEYTSDHEFFRDCMETKFGEAWTKWSGRPERINALVEKNREGPKGDARLLFLKSSTLFVDYDGWLKGNGFRPASKGEESRYREAEGQGHLAGGPIDPEDVPS